MKKTMIFASELFFSFLCGKVTPAPEQFINQVRKM
jgi:hypothetical protein